MITGLPDLLAENRHRGCATLAFTSYDLATACAVVEAAETRDAGLILLISSQAFQALTGPALVAALLVLAEDAAVPVCVQLDHESDLSHIETALKAGVGAVMADGSKLAYEENVALVTEAVRLAARYGAHIEAELGRVEGDEEFATAAAAGALTDPALAEDFVRRTGAACLAVSIGNVHGTYHEPPRLDWGRLGAVRSVVPVPLSLHGASGLPETVLRAAVQQGIAKVNVNTELRDAWFDTVLDRAPALAEGAQLLHLQREIHDAIARVAGAKLTALDTARAYSPQQAQETPVP